MIKVLTKFLDVFYQVFIYPFHKIYFGKFGKQSKIILPNIIEFPKNIFIGNNVLIRKQAWLAANPLTDNKNCKLIIGDGTYVGNFAHFYATSKIEIGQKVLIADRVYISDNSHGFKNINIAIIDQPITQLQEVLIDDGSWLGENVCIIGANIGKNSIVGANSVVTKNIPDYCIAVGIPAKIIKRFCLKRRDWFKTDAAGNFIENI
jgi:acetyltransferase-like isoleucine patch superfamily enzyme